MGVIERIASDKIRAITVAAEWAEAQFPRLRADVLNDAEGALARQYHAAAVFRMPGVLRAIKTLVEDGLLFEAEGCLRTLVD